MSKSIIIGKDYVGARGEVNYTRDTTIIIIVVINITIIIIITIVIIVVVVVIISI